MRQSHLMPSNRVIPYVAASDSQDLRIVIYPSDQRGLIGQYGAGVMHGSDGFDGDIGYFPCMIKMVHYV